LRALEKAAAAPVGTPWICGQCGEKLEPQFTTCWRCGAGFQPP
jgi:predicted amidophosphoribosyltransferase